MNVPEKAKVEPNTIVIFKKYFLFNGIEFNAVAQKEDGTMLFLDTEAYETDGNVKFYYGNEAK